MMVEYREMVRRKYEELDDEKGTVDGEWRQYKDAFVGVAEELEDDRRRDRERGASAHRLNAPVWPEEEEEGSQEGGGQNTEEYEGRTVPNA